MYGKRQTATDVAFVMLVVVFVACREQHQRSLAGSGRPPLQAGLAVPPRMSEEGLRRIRDDEAFISRVYDDGVGNQTVGYGHLLRPGESFPGGITDQRARELLATDVARIVNPALDRVTVPLTQNQVEALGSFIYNVGPGNFARSILPALNAGDFRRVMDQMADFVRGKNQRTGELVTLRGLQRRRNDEIALFGGAQGAS